ncbi:hypothetical protein SUGI_1124350 [Cryptomeria japonica]|uniref:uncharacterized protein LOC131041286 isoform X1 n=2 Tax=Cryptomeria japonica TaxID=3369 RepID=UPI002414CFEA|nr:uncharacterized protein LOC131041286 isoform X1 [Cryptomeria japonica]XP_059070833.1 uncharacterized protein LOC131041286 isoform X1 [Cryptomeria japonica]GLJ52786.1 hypothetical protein SUGI_1124350 [Cryptomeria japonica]
MDSWVGSFLRGGLTKHCMTPSETAHREKVCGVGHLNSRNTEKLQSLKLTCLVRLTRMITNGTWVADSKLTQSFFATYSMTGWQHVAAIEQLFELVVFHNGVFKTARDGISLASFI